MDPLLSGGLAAFWLGLLTAISPCPLTTNILAVSYIGRRVGRPGLVLASGLLYMAGRTFVYVTLGWLLVFSILSAYQAASFLEETLKRSIGPILVLTGVLLSGWFPITVRAGGMSESVQRRVERWGVWGAGFLGVVFALSFCPISAGLFFGSLIPLAVRDHSPVVLPLLYGLGTALPVLVFAFLIAWSAGSVGKWFSAVAKVEQMARRITVILFILGGIYLTLIYTLKMKL